ncbi:hypothetical protein [Bhargavaea ginsengi]|uniref:hypothetical protein n=1 Tax=Bhargavaea ginsengi TaxID=426757 RepID=UPI003C746ACF
MNDETGAANDEIETLNDEIARPNDEIGAVNDEIKRRMVDSEDALQGKALLQNSLQERFSYFSVLLINLLSSLLNLSCSSQKRP